MLMWASLPWVVLYGIAWAFASTPILSSQSSSVLSLSHIPALNWYSQHHSKASETTIYVLQTSYISNIAISSIGKKKK